MFIDIGMLKMKIISYQKFVVINFVCQFDILEQGILGKVLIVLDEWGEYLWGIFFDC